MWQDFVFTAGSVFGIIVLMPTLKDRMATVPLGTALPSGLIGLVYGSAFLTMGMTFSAAGSFATGLLWSLIAILRSPSSPMATPPADTTDAAADSTTGHAPAGD